MVSEIILNNMNINTSNIIININNMNIENMNIININNTNLININNTYLLLRTSAGAKSLHDRATIQGALLEFSRAPFTIEYKLYSEVRLDSLCGSPQLPPSSLAL